MSDWRKIVLCSLCGKGNPADAKVCLTCGTNIPDYEQIARVEVDIRRMEIARADATRAETVKKMEIARAEYEEIAQVERDADIRSMEIARAERDSAIKKTEVARVERDSAIQRMEIARTERDASIKKMESVPAESGSNIRSMEIARTERDAAIKKMEIARAERDAAIQRMEIAPTERDSDIRRMEIDRDERDETVKKMESARVERDEAIKKVESAQTERDNAIIRAELARDWAIMRAKTDCDDAIQRAGVERDAAIKKMETERDDALETAKGAKTILQEASLGFPWLARALADFETLEFLRTADALATKKHPALTSAEHVRDLRKRSVEYKVEYRVTRARLDYYEALFPWLEDYVGIDLDSLIQFAKQPVECDEAADPVCRYLALGEYRSLSEEVRNQLALDRYLAQRKSPWELGRDYERFVGYRFEQDGFDVTYHGITEGLYDLGRDLIVKKENDVRIIQCKYWAKHKCIREKHIAQLFGTTVKYWIEMGKPANAVPAGLFVTSTQLSDEAKAFAEQLNIVVEENVDLDPYPMIKCNIGRDVAGQETRIYHLPMDQQYDKTKISRTGECYVATVADAHRLGFRRAWKWHPVPE